MPDIPTILTTIQGAPIIIDSAEYDKTVYGDIVCENPTQKDYEAFIAKQAPAEEKAEEKPKRRGRPKKASE